MFEAGEKVLLSEITSALKDGTHGTHERVADGIPLLSAKNITDRGEITWTPDDDFISEVEYRQIHKRFQLKPGDLLLTIVGSLGRRAVYKGQRVTFQRSVAFIRPECERVDHEYLFHFFGHTSFTRQLIERSNATAQAGLYLGELAKTKIRWFPLIEQKKIAQILDTLDTQIRQTEALIAKLERIKHGLLTDLLTRGIDQNGQLRPTPDQAPHLYKDSPLGRIPRDWTVDRLGDVIDQHGGVVQTGPFGSQLHAEEYVEQGVPVVMPQDMRDIEVSSKNIAQITERRASDLSRHRVKPSDLLFSRRGDLSRCCFMSSQNDGWVCGTGCLLLRPPGSVINGYWLAHAYKQVSAQSQILGMAVGSTMVNLNSSILRSLLLALPPMREQEAFEAEVKAMNERIHLEKSQLRKLRMGRGGLTDDLLRGRVRVVPLLEMVPSGNPSVETADGL